MDIYKKIAILNILRKQLLEEVAFYNMERWEQDEFMMSVMNTEKDLEDKINGR